MNLPQGAELIILLVIVLLVFGIGRIGKLGEELGKGVRAFRQGVKEGSEETGPKTTKDEPEAPREP
jgi:sec-independent protein translocase protein TatA